MRFTQKQRVSTWARFHNNQIGAEGIVSMGNVIGRVGVLLGMLSKPISLVPITLRKGMKKTFPAGAEVLVQPKRLTASYAGICPQYPGC